MVRDTQSSKPCGLSEGHACCTQTGRGSDGKVLVEAIHGCHFEKILELLKAAWDGNGQWKGPGALGRVGIEDLILFFESSVLLRRESW